MCLNWIFVLPVDDTLVCSVSFLSNMASIFFILFIQYDLLTLFLKIFKELDEANLQI